MLPTLFQMLIACELLPQYIINLDQVWVEDLFWFPDDILAWLKITLLPKCLPKKVLSIDIKLYQSQNMCYI